MQTNGMQIFLAGATRGVGLEIAMWLVAHEYSVTALVRTADACSELAGLGVRTTVGDALDRETVISALEDSAAQAVISTIGGVRDGQRSDYLGNKHLMDAAVQLGIPRFLLVSSIGAGDSVIALPPHVLEALRPALVEKNQAEQYLIQSGLKYTIVRPGGLKSEPATGNGMLTEDPSVAGSIHRADVASLVCQCLQSERAQGKVLLAVDRNQRYSQTDVQEFDLEL